MIEKNAVQLTDTIAPKVYYILIVIFIYKPSLTLFFDRMVPTCDSYKKMLYFCNKRK